MLELPRAGVQAVVPGDGGAELGVPVRLIAGVRGQVAREAALPRSKKEEEEYMASEAIQGGEGKMLRQQIDDPI